MTYPNFSLRILLVSYPDYYWVNTKYRVWKKLKTHYKTNLVRSIKMLVIRLWWPYIKISWSIRQLLVIFRSFFCVKIGQNSPLYRFSYSALNLKSNGISHEYAFFKIKFCIFSSHFLDLSAIFLKNWKKKELLQKICSDVSSKEF